MPRTYKPDPRGKKYLKYDVKLIEEAVNEYSEGGSSLDIVAKKYNIHRSVLYRHCTRNMKSQGGQTVLKKQTELEFIKYINTCAEWGYPMETYDLRILVKIYLDKLGVNEKRFKNNMPGPDFVASFLKRHKDSISQRISQNIKRNRAAVSPEVIEKYFEELKISLNDVPMYNVINYDETNLADDPGRKKIITKKGVKYPERVMNQTKSAVSIMMSCTAEGELLPPYVVYKAQHLYDTWTAKGPQGARYNRSQSGWFDGTIFEDWVKSVIIPYFKEKPGKKVLIGDNLSSHLSIDLIKLCQEENISFVFLPANSTHLTQPLDVAFFRPMKIAWRNILCQWKKTDGRQLATIPKGCFPSLLSILINSLKDNAKENILAGFKKSGIYPLDSTQVLKRIPGYEVTHQTETINESVLTILRDMRYGTINVVEPKRKRKIEVEPGKSVSLEESHADTEIENKDPKKKKIKTEVQTAKNKEGTKEDKKKEPKTKKGKGIGKKSKPPLLHSNVSDETKSIVADYSKDNLEINTSQIFFNKKNHITIEPSTSKYTAVEQTTMLSQQKKKELITKKGKGIGKISKPPLPHQNVSYEPKSITATCSNKNLEVNTSQIIFTDKNQIAIELSTNKYTEVNKTTMLSQQKIDETHIFNDSYLDIETTPIIFEDDILTSQYETIENLNVSDTLASNIKTNNKIKILSDITVADPKLVQKNSYYDNNNMKFIRPDTKLQILEKVESDNQDIKKTQRKVRNYYRSDEEIFSDLMSDID